MTLLSVENLGKSYRGYHSEWQRFARWFYLPVKPTEEHWVIRGVNFSIEPGEAIGIVGENGAGKSTLLKMITGTLEPTEGQVQINGRIAAILELGMGFASDLTGEENVIHAAGLMGYGSRQILQVLPDIEEFAEIGDYFRQPVRTYSSGMQMRVAFAVATAFRPDLLIVDEALSVGDSYFQHKCMQRIRNYQKQGMSLLLVSHAPDTVKMLCQRGILLSEGGVIKDGDAASVMDFYRSRLVMRTSVTEDEYHLSQGQPTQASRDSRYILSSKTAGQVQASISGSKASLESGDEISINIAMQVTEALEDPHIGFGVRTKMGITIYEANTYTLKKTSKPVATGETLQAEFTFPCHLVPDTYELVIGVADGGYDQGSFKRSVFFDQSFLLFEIQAGEENGWGGLYNIQPQVSYLND